MNIRTGTITINDVIQTPSLTGERRIERRLQTRAATTLFTYKTIDDGTNDVSSSLALHRQVHQL